MYNDNPPSTITIEPEKKTHIGLTKEDIPMLLGISMIPLLMGAMTIYTLLQPPEEERVEVRTAYMADFCLHYTNNSGSTIENCTKMPHLKNIEYMPVSEYAARMQDPEYRKTVFSAKLLKEIREEGLREASGDFSGAKKMSSMPNTN